VVYSLLQITPSQQHRSQGIRLKEDHTNVESLRGLDPQALSLVHDQYYREVFRYVTYRVSESAVAEDITSEAFTRLVEAVGTKQKTIRNVRGWLLGTASNLVSDYFRRTYRQPAESLDTIQMEELVSNGDTFETLGDHLQIQSALRKLTEDQQRVIALRFGGQYSLEETAAILRKRPGAIKALQYRALEALRRQLLGEQP
jgi:RNA polymerase sigma-70 factor (ECF subfamily)